MRALIALLLALQATPAVWRASSVRAAVLAPLPTGQRDLTLRTHLGPVRAIWLHDGDRDHLAIREPLGPPAAILRSDGARVGVTLRGHPEVVAQGDMAVRLTTAGALGVGDLLPLLAGRLPDGVQISPLGGGWLALHGGLVAVLSRDGRLLGATYGPLTLAGDRLTYGSTAVRVQLGPLTERPIPEGAFTVADGAHLPAESLAQLLSSASRTSAISN